MADFQDVSYDTPLEGNIEDTLNPSIEDNEDELSTLDEPVKETFVRQIYNLGIIMEIFCILLTMFIVLILIMLINSLLLTIVKSFGYSIQFHFSIFLHFEICIF